MKLTKILGIAAVAALALMAFASSASATTLETDDVTQLGGVTLEASLTTGTSALLSDTAKSFGNTCTKSTVEGKTTTFTGATVGGPLLTLAFSGCTHEKVVVNNPGSLSVAWISGSTNGTVRSTGASVTVPVGLFGGTNSVTCTTNNTDIGTLTGAPKGGAAEMDISAVLNCGFLLPSALWSATYVMTVPGTTTEAKHAIGVVG